MIVKVFLTLVIDEEEYPVPVDGFIGPEIEDTLHDYIHDVDGISGATFTGVGVDEMLGRNMEVYNNFFKSNPDFLK